MNHWDPSNLSGGPGVIEYLMRWVCRRQLTQHQATVLWQECKTRLLAIDLATAVQAAEACTKGKLDLSMRDKVLDAVTQVLTQQSKPDILVDDPARCASFLSALESALQERGYAVIDVAAQTRKRHANA